MGLGQCVRLHADVADLRAQRRIAQIGEIDFVDLQIAAAGCGEVGDLLAIDVREIVVKFLDVGVGFAVDRVAAAAKMQCGWRRDGDFRGHLRDRFKKLEIVDEDPTGRASLPVTCRLGGE